tara:strand:- start:78 stop:671 length:594 start_codon:yes stop_codon:yes gene_type:complete
VNFGDFAISTQNFIHTYRLPNLEVCDEAINFFKQRSDLHQTGKVFEDNLETVNKAAKDSIDIQENFDFFNREPCFSELLKFLWSCTENYASTYEELWESSFRIVDTLKLQYYKPPSGGFKLFHSERNSAQCHNCLVWMLYLNTVNDGGGTEFRYLDYTEKAEKGKLVIWPSDFTHAHRGIPSFTEEKYIFTGWYEFT